MPKRNVMGYYEQKAQKKRKKKKEEPKRDKPKASKPKENKPSSKGNERRAGAQRAQQNVQRAAQKVSHKKPSGSSNKPQQRTTKTVPYRGGVYKPSSSVNAPKKHETPKQTVTRVTTNAYHGAKTTNNRTKQQERREGQLRAKRAQAVVGDVFQYAAKDAIATTAKFIADAGKNTAKDPDYKAFGQSLKNAAEGKKTGSYKPASQTGTTPHKISPKSKINTRVNPRTGMVETVTDMPKGAHDFADKWRASADKELKDATKNISDNKDIEIPEVVDKIPVVKKMLQSTEKQKREAAKEIKSSYKQQYENNKYWLTRDLTKQLDDLAKEYGLTDDTVLTNGQTFAQYKKSVMSDAIRELYTEATTARDADVQKIMDDAEIGKLSKRDLTKMGAELGVVGAEIMIPYIGTAGKFLKGADALLSGSKALTAAQGGSRALTAAGKTTVRNAMKNAMKNGDDVAEAVKDAMKTVKRSNFKESVKRELLANAMQDATIGTTFDYAMTRKEGLEGKEALSYMGESALLNAAFGGVVSGIAGRTTKAGKLALTNDVARTANELTELTKTDAIKLENLLRKQEKGTITADETVRLEELQSKALGEGGVIVNKKGKLEVNKAEYALDDLTKQEVKDYYKLKSQDLRGSLDPRDQSKFNYLQAKVDTAYKRTEKFANKAISIRSGKIKSRDQSDIENAVRFFERTGETEKLAKAQKSLEIAKEKTRQLNDSLSNATKMMTEKTGINYKWVSEEEMLLNYGTREQGFTDPKTGEVVINRDSPQAWQAVLGHETGHVIKMSNADAFRALGDELEAYARELGEFEDLDALMRRRYPEYQAREGDSEAVIKEKEENMREEMVSEMIGRYIFGEDDKYLKKLAGEQPTTLQRIVAYIRQLISNTKNKELAERLTKMQDDALNAINETKKTDWKERGLEEVKGKAKEEYIKKSQLAPVSGKDGMYSYAYEAAAKLGKSVKSDSDSLLKYFQKKGVTAEEMKWTGLGDYIRANSPLSKQQLLDFIDANNYELYTVVRANDEYATALGKKYNESTRKELQNILKKDRDLLEDISETLGMEEQKILEQPRKALRAYGLEPEDMVEPPNIPDRAKWEQYSLRGGKNYREYEYVDPRMTGYSNQAMDVHWSGDNDVVVHSRIQDFTAQSAPKYLDDMDVNVETVSAVGDHIEDMVRYAGDRPTYTKIDWLDEDFGVPVEIEVFEPKMGEVSAHITSTETGELYSEIVKQPRDAIADAVANELHRLGRDGEIVTFKANKGENKVLHVEEIQSDWHNEGAKHGYQTEEQKSAIALYKNKLENLADERKELNREYDELQNKELKYLYYGKDTDEIRIEMARLDRKMRLNDEAQRDAHIWIRRYNTAGTPEAPYKNNYTDYAMKRALREAVENDYDIISWTTAKQQADRWSDEYMEGYRIEYDQDIPSFMRRYVKQWGGEVEKIRLAENGEEVWAVRITDEMRDSIKNEGQRRFSRAGKNAQGVDKDAAEIAEGLFSDGWSRKEIKDLTGWRIDTDGKAWFEFSDAGMKLKFKLKEIRGRGTADELFALQKKMDDVNDRMEEMRSNGYTNDSKEMQPLWDEFGKYLGESQRLDRGITETRLGDLIDHDELFKYYPDLKNMEVRFDDTMPRHTHGEFNESYGSPVITLNPKCTKKEMESALIHEVQHVLQQKEGFASGSSPEFWADVIRKLSEKIEKTKNKLPNGLGKNVSDKEAVKLLEQHGKMQAAEDLKRYLSAQDEIKQNSGMKGIDAAPPDSDLAKLYNSGKFQYYNTRGEMDARLTEERRNLTQEQLDKNPREDTIPYTEMDEASLRAEDFKEGGKYEDVNESRRFSRAVDKAKSSKKDTTLDGEIQSILKDKHLKSGSEKALEEDLRAVAKLIGEEKVDEAIAKTEEIVRQHMEIDEYEHVDNAIDQNVKELIKSAPINIAELGEGTIAHKLENIGMTRADVPYWVQLRSKKGGMPLDRVYQQLSDERPDLFPPDVTHEDKLKTIIEAATPQAEAVRKPQDWIDGERQDLAVSIFSKVADGVYADKRAVESAKGIETARAEVKAESKLTEGEVNGSEQQSLNGFKEPADVAEAPKAESGGAQEVDIGAREADMLNEFREGLAIADETKKIIRETKEFSDIQKAERLRVDRTILFHKRNKSDADLRELDRMKSELREAMDAIGARTEDELWVMYDNVLKEAEKIATERLEAAGKISKKSEHAPTVPKESANKKAEEPENALQKGEVKNSEQQAIDGFEETAKIIEEPKQTKKAEAKKPKKPEDTRTEVQKMRESKYVSKEVKSALDDIEEVGVFTEKAEKAAKKYNDLDAKIAGKYKHIENAKNKEYPTEAEKTANIAELEDDLRVLKGKQTKVAGEIEDMAKMKKTDPNKTWEQERAELDHNRKVNRSDTAEKLKQEDSWIKDKWTSLRRLWEDSLIDVERTAKGVKQDPQLRGEILTAANRVRNSASMTNFWVTKGRKTFDNKVGGKPLDEIFPKALIKDEKKYADFQEYLVMKHVEARHKKGTDIYADVTPEKAQKIIDGLEERYAVLDKDGNPVLDKDGNPVKSEIEAWADEVYAYLKDLQQYRVDSGILTKEAAEQFAEDYPFYVPTNRARDDEPIDFFTGGLSNQIRTAKGGDAPVLDMYAQLYTATNKTIHAAEENNMLNLYFRAKGVTKEQLKGKQLPDLEHAVINATVNKKTGAAKVSFFVDGVPVEYPCSHQLALGLRELDGMEFERLMKAAKVATLYGKPFKALITDWNLVFGVRNGMRDIQQAVVNSKDTRYFGSSFGAAAHSIANKNSPYRKAYASMGGEHAQLVSYDAVAQNMGIEKGKIDKIHETVQDFVDASVNINGREVHTNVIHYIEGINGAIEMMPRMCEFIGTIRKEADKILKKDGSSLKELRNEVKKEVQALEKEGKIGQSEIPAEVENRLAERILDMVGKDTLDTAMRNANDITLNFGRSGVLGKALNMGFVPYLNPSIQGLSKLGRLFTEAGQEGGWKALASLGMKIALLNVSFAALNEIALKDNEAYQSLNTRDKDNNYFIPLGDDKFIKIPKPRENAVLIEPVEYALRHHYNETEYAFFDWDKMTMESEHLFDKIPLTDEGKQAFRTAIDNIGVINPMTSNMFSPLAQTLNNKTWYGGDIESAYEIENKKVKDRYDSGTTGLAIALGKTRGAQALNLSPKKIDNILDSYTGMIYDLWLSQRTEEAKTRGNYIVRTMASQFTKDAVFSNKLSTKAWEKTDGMTEEELQKYKGTYMYDAFRYDDAIDRITADKTMTNEEKMTAKRELRKKKNELNRAAIDGTANKSDPLSDIAKYLGATDTLENFLPEQKDKKGKPVDDDWESYFDRYEKANNYDGMTKKQKEKASKAFLDVYTLGVKGQKVASPDSFHDSPKWNMTAVAIAQSQKNGKITKEQADLIATSCGVWENSHAASDKYVEKDGNVKELGISNKRVNKTLDKVSEWGIDTKSGLWKGGFSKTLGAKNGTIAMSLATDKETEFKDRSYYIEMHEDPMCLDKMNAARGFSKRYKHKTKEISQLAIQADALGDSNTYLKNDEIIEACNAQDGWSDEERSMGYILLGGSPKKNPFGDIGDYSIDGDTGIEADEEEDKKGGGGGRGRRRRGGWGRHGGGGGGGGKTPFTPVVNTAGEAAKQTVTKVKTSRAKVSNVTKPTDYTKPSNLNDAYRKRVRKLREQTRKH